MMRYVAERVGVAVEIRAARFDEDGKTLGEAFRDAKLMAGWHREVAP